jgi:hypothetical protein
LNEHCDRRSVVDQLEYPSLEAALRPFFGECAAVWAHQDPNHVEGTGMWAESRAPVERLEGELFTTGS